MYRYMYGIRNCSTLQEQSATLALTEQSVGYSCSGYSPRKGG